MKYPQYEDSYIINPIFISVYYTVKLYLEFPKWVWVRTELIKSKKFTSDCLSLYIIDGIKKFILNNININMDLKAYYNDKSTLERYNGFSTLLYYLLIFIYIDEPNFWITLQDFMDQLFECHIIIMLTMQ